ncbi:MAG TPA: phosphoserine phosphatase SerB, partial [Cellulomonas sp.]
MPRPTRLVVMDVDSTLITQEVVELLAEHAGSRAEVADITERAMRGELDFTESLRARVATLAGLPVSVFEAVLAEVVVTPGAVELLAELDRRGWPVGLVSGGFVEVVGPLAGRLGIPRFHANALEVEHGALTGRVAGEVVDRAVKARTLREFAAGAGVPLDRTVAIGDG